MNANDTTQPNDPGQFEAITLEKFKEALAALKLSHNRPRKCFYTNSITYGKILDGMMTETNYMIYVPLGAIELITDNDIEPDTIIYCEPGLYDIWKRLKAHPWIDLNDKKIDLWKVAASLFEAEKSQNNNPVKIDWTFTEGEKFPAGATIKGLKIDKRWEGTSEF